MIRINKRDDSLLTSQSEVSIMTIIIKWQDRSNRNGHTCAERHSNLVMFSISTHSVVVSGN